ncbi:hypothetical protein [Halalkalibacterium ligniniphilum]|uniref:hypothetical protein n=1 Tax=Halalkalibacterium ligniniphilum TaxID=1134413 RepID=UPI00034D6B92|nr:hypothetical protein [Halalkalibacterium ligniniphilum]
MSINIAQMSGFFCGKGDGASVQVVETMRPFRSHRLHCKGVQRYLTALFHPSGKSDPLMQVFEEKRVGNNKAV